MRYLLTGPPAERVERAGYAAVFVAIPRTKERHLERYRYRAFLFEPAARSPVLAVNLESDILGEYILTLEDARERSVLDRFDREPSYEEYRNRVLEEAGRKMPPGGTAPRPLSGSGARRARGGGGSSATAETKPPRESHEK
jgi:hypothetical protein